MSDPDRLPIELPREWLRYAEGDLRVAEREWDDLLPEGEVLNEYVIAGRYPGDLSVDDIGKTEVEEALQAVRRIRERVTALMAEG